MKTPMSPSMFKLLTQITENGGQVTRLQGGFWVTNPDGATRSWGTVTVEALVKRGHLEYFGWRDGRNGSFPIAARIPATGAGAQGKGAKS